MTDLEKLKEDIDKKGKEFDKAKNDILCYRDDLCKKFDIPYFEDRLCIILSCDEIEKFFSLTITYTEKLRDFAFAIRKYEDEKYLSEKKQWRRK